MAKNCTHRDVTKVLTIGKCELWAGSQAQVKRQIGRFDLVISLLNDKDRGRLNFRISRGSGRMLSRVSEYRRRRSGFLSIEWPDMQAPDLERDFWEALHQDLSHLDGRAVIYCMGGHGRTGTALTILATLSKACGDMDPVRWVREQYCESAVETKAQIDYLQDTIGVATTASPSHGGFEHFGGKSDWRDKFPGTNWK
jgi:hypothetical protein